MEYVDLKIFEELEKIKPNIKTIAEYIINQLALCKLTDHCLNTITLLKYSEPEFDSISLDSGFKYVFVFYRTKNRPSMASYLNIPIEVFSSESNVAQYILSKKQKFKQRLIKRRMKNIIK